jgi:anthranilate phosphoribosyltransferase
VRAVARTLARREHAAVLDLLALNAAACLRLMGRVATWQEGIARARQAVLDGAAIEQLRALIRAQNRDPGAGLARLEAFIVAPAGAAEMS